MDGIREYLFSVIAAALICGLVTAILGKDGAIAAIGRLVCGVFLAMTAIGPLAEISLRDLQLLSDGLHHDAQDAVLSGQIMAADALQSIIKDKTQAYILDKARQLDTEVTVEISLSDEVPYAPDSITIKGDVSPYAKTVLTELMENDLGISREEQEWIR